ncbi:hypothetical protein Tco_0408182, partial [Tanacetum coccineum]
NGPDHFSSDDLSSSSSSSSSSETSSDSSANALSDSASIRSSSDHSLPASLLGTISSHHLCPLVSSVHRSSAIFKRPSHDSSFASLSHKRSRSPVASVPLSSSTLGALPYACVDLLPLPKRIRINFEDESSEPSRSRGSNLEMDVDVERSDEIEIDPKVQAEIDEFIAYAYALRDRGIDARVVVEAIDQEEIETGMRGPVEVRVDRVTHLVVADDILELAQEGAVEVTYETLGDLVQRFHDHTEEILARHVQLERDNKRLIDIMDIESPRVTQFQRSLRLVPGGIWVTVLKLFRDYPSIDSTMPNTRSRASRTHEGINEQSNHRMAEALRVRDAVRNLGPLMGDEGEQGEVNGGNGNGGNGND